MFMVGNHTSVVNPLHFPETLCNVIMRTNHKAGLLSSTGEQCLYFFAREKKKGIQLNWMINVGLRDVKSNSDALAFKWPFYILTLFFHGVSSHATAPAKLFGFALPTQFTLYPRMILSDASGFMCRVQKLRYIFFFYQF